MENKITYTMAIDEALKVVTNEEVAEKLIALKDSLAKKSGAKKISEKEVAKRDSIKESLLEGLKTIGKGTVTEICKASEFGEEDVSSQKATAMLKKLIEEDHLVTKGKEGKSMVYSLVE